MLAAVRRALSRLRLSKIELGTKFSGESKAPLCLCDRTTRTLHTGRRQPADQAHRSHVPASTTAFTPTCYGTAAATRWPMQAMIPGQSSLGWGIGQFSTRSGTRSWCRRALRISGAIELSRSARSENSAAAAAWAFTAKYALCRVGVRGFSCLSRLQPRRPKRQQGEPQSSGRTAPVAAMLARRERRAHRDVEQGRGFHDNPTHCLSSQL
jgi:hypothetical protein